MIHESARQPLKLESRSGADLRLQPMVKAEFPPISTPKMPPTCASTESSEESDSIREPGVRTSCTLNTPSAAPESKAECEPLKAVTTLGALIVRTVFPVVELRSRSSGAFCATTSVWGFVGWCSNVIVPRPGLSSVVQI